jgi:outer membrane protein assembly factor BamA
MSRPALLTLAALPILACALLLFPALPLSAQTYQPKIILFTGQTEYTDAELLAAAGLKKNQPLTAQQMNDISKKLLDLGVFDNVAFTFNGQTLAFQLIPATKLYPARLENVPLVSGKDLDAKIHARAPLYHGMVPTEGGLLDDVRHALEAELAARGVPAQLVAMPATDPALGIVIAVGFSVTSPQILVGDITVKGASEALSAGARAAVAPSTGALYNLEGSANVVAMSLSNFYRNHAYLRAECLATPQLAAPPPVDASGVHVPFVLTVNEGAQYHVAKIELEPSLSVTQEAYDKQASVHPGDLALLNKLHTDWEYIGRGYRNQGHMKARVNATATYDEPSGRVNYVISADPGPQYRMGILRVATVPEDVRSAIQAVWKMPRGSVFNEGAILGFFASYGVNPTIEKFMKTASMRYTLHLNDEERTVDVDLRFEKLH